VDHHSVLLRLERPDVDGDDSLRGASPDNSVRSVDLLDGRGDVETSRLPAERGADLEQALGLGAINVLLP
jgi:hypothetical protein